MDRQTISASRRESGITPNQFDAFDRTAPETEAEALHRLAAQAHAKGVALIVDEDNRHWATSASRPGEKHVVTFYSCDCVGFARHGRCHHYALVLEAYHSLPPIEPEPTPGGGVAAPATLPAILPDKCPEGADVVLSVVPAPSPLDRANRAAIVAYLDSGETRRDRWELVSALLGEDYFVACGMTDRALAAWCRDRVGLPSLERVCGSPMCAGAGSLAGHPTDDPSRCPVCRGTGVVPGHSVAVELVYGEVRRAA